MASQAQQNTSTNGDSLNGAAAPQNQLLEKVIRTPGKL
jgi:hypothetical protein